MVGDSNDGLILSNQLTDGSKVVFSRLHTYQAVEKQSRFFSIKLALEGVERYRVNGQTHRIQSGQFLLINNQQAFEVELQANRPVLGLCLFLNEQRIADVYRNLSFSEDQLLDNPQGSNTPLFDFTEMVFDVRQNALGEHLQQVAAHTDRSNGCIDLDDQTLYCQTAEALLRAQRVVRAQLRCIPAQRLATRQELFRRVNVARQYLDEHFADEVSNAQLAQLAALSEHHFFRTFKLVFGYSPHQYLIHRRLKQAAEWLRTRSFTVSEVAHLTGFADVYSFSKAFRKAYGLPPSAFQNSKI